MILFRVFEIGARIYQNFNRNEKQTRKAFFSLYRAILFAWPLAVLSVFTFEMFRSHRVFFVGKYWEMKRAYAYVYFIKSNEHMIRIRI